MTPSPAYGRLLLFNALWAVAHLGHFLRKGPSMSPLVWVILLLAVVLLERPGSKLRLGALATAQLLFLAQRMPTTDNHLYIMGFINLGLLVSLLLSGRPWREWRPATMHAMTAHAGAGLLIAYAGAALAKLNAGSLTPS